MSDEANTRRSARATKGQHKNLDLLEPVEAPKKRSGKKGSAKAKQASQEPSAAEEEGSEDVIRCICGVTDQEDDDGESWIACEKCNVWQHNVCVAAPLDPEEAEKTDYFCEQCKPENHKEYYEALEKGVKIWETRRQKLIEEQAAAKVKKGKKGKARKSAGAEIRAATPQSIKTGTPAPAESNKKTASTKRKTREDSHDGQAGMNKAPKLSTQDHPSPTPKVQNATSTADFTNAVKKLDVSRQKPVESLYKAFVVSLGKARQTSTFAGQNVEQMAQSLAIDLEKAVEKLSISKDSYGKQMRALFSNLKTNPELTTRVLRDFTYIETLANMPVADMATKERQQQDEEMRARAEKQAIMVTEESTGPRIRRTHKGDELVEFDQDSSGSPEVNQSDRRRSMADPNHGMGARSREGTPGHYQDTAQENDTGPSGDTIRQNALGQGQLPRLDTAGSPGARRASMAKDNFDINSIYSQVQTPASAHHRTGSSASQAFPTPQPQHNIHDADVDRLLEDDGDDDAYDPPDYEERDPTVVWRGTMTMTSIADFPAVARHIAGGHLRGMGSEWGDLLEDRLSVAGRIDPGKAEEYLCSLRFSKYTDVCVIALSPTGGRLADAQFLSLYQHFESKGKYGVLGSKASDRGNIRDTYLIPVAPGHPERPEFLQNFEVNNMPSDRSDPMILIAIVVRTEGSPVSMGGDGSGDHKLSAQNRSLSIGQQQGPSMSPVVQQGQGFGSNPQTPQQGQYGGGYGQQQQQRPAGQDVGYNPAYPAQGMPPQQQHLPPLSSITPSSTHPMAHTPSTPQPRPTPQDAYDVACMKAKQILGEYAQCEVANFLMTQAHKMVDKEWWIIREVFESSEEARRDVRVFSTELETRGPHNQTSATDLDRVLARESDDGEMGEERKDAYDAALNGHAHPAAVIPVANGHAFQNVVMGGMDGSPGREQENL